MLKKTSITSIIPSTENDVRDDLGTTSLSIDSDAPTAKLPPAIAAVKRLQYSNSEIINMPVGARTQTPVFALHSLAPHQQILSPNQVEVYLQQDRLELADVSEQLSHRLGEVISPVDSLKVVVRRMKELHSEAMNAEYNSHFELPRFELLQKLGNAVVVNQESFLYQKAQKLFSLTVHAPEEIIQEWYRAPEEHHHSKIRFVKVGDVVFDIEGDYLSLLWKKKHPDVKTELFRDASQLLKKQICQMGLLSVPDVAIKHKLLLEINKMLNVHSTALTADSTLINHGRYLRCADSGSAIVRVNQGVDAVLAPANNPGTHIASSSWAACVKKIYEVDPLECPKCKSQMRIIAFVQEPNAIKAMMKSLGLPEYRAPPPLNFRSRSVFDEQLCMDDIPACGEFDRTDYDS